MDYNLQKKIVGIIAFFLYGYKFLMWLFQSIIVLFYIPILMFVFGSSFDNPWQDRYPKFLYFPTVCFLIICFYPIFLALGSLFFIITIPGYCLKNKAISFLLDLMGL